MAAAVCCRHSKIPLRAHSTASQGMGKAPAAATLERAGLEVELVSCLGDNYCPVVHHAASQVTIVMDTPEAGPIASAIRRRGWTLTHILNTHYHGDHVGGNLELKAQFPGVQIVGHRSQEFKYPGPYPPPGVEHEVIPGIDLEVREGDEVLCGGLKARVLEVGGHTAAHIAYFFHEVPMAFAGDALFPMGCGRVFTGDFVRMQASLQKLRDLPDETVVFCSHEYTKANVDFAVKVEPGNAALLARQAEVQKLRSADEPTVPTILGNEKATNPFLRWDAPEVQQAVGMTEAAAVFTAVRKWKDTGHRPQAKL
ncbi:unnamed protein product [Effrenium voratum]|nr:unnamed protein product [Effrenium voratum]CAJ1419607.1 unnamed protein product [Effrenium voratum]